MKLYCVPDANVVPVKVAARVQAVPFGINPAPLVTVQGVPLVAVVTAPAVLLRLPPVPSTWLIDTSLVPLFWRRKVTTPLVVEYVACVMLSCSTRVYVKVRAPNQAATAIAIATVTATRMIVAITGLSALVFFASLRVFRVCDLLLGFLRYPKGAAHLNLAS